MQNFDPIFLKMKLDNQFDSSERSRIGDEAYKSEVGGLGEYLQVAGDMKIDQSSGPISEATIVGRALHKISGLIHRKNDS